MWLQPWSDCSPFGWNVGFILMPTPALARCSLAVLNSIKRPGPLDPSVMLLFVYLSLNERISLWLRKTLFSPDSGYILPGEGKEDCKLLCHCYRVLSIGLNSIFHKLRTNPRSWKGSKVKAQVKLAALGPFRAMCCMLQGCVAVMTHRLPIPLWPLLYDSKHY